MTATFLTGLGSCGARRVLGRLLLLVGLAAPGCAADPKSAQWERDFYWTERLYMDGQHELAAKRFGALRQASGDARDADEAALLQCEAQARGGQAAAAAACYDQLGLNAAERPMRIRALMHAGELRYYQLGMKDAALKLWTWLLIRAPDQAATQRALDHLYLHAEGDASRRDAAVRTWLQIEAQDPRSDIADNLLLRAAMLLEQDGRPEQVRLGITLLEKHERDHAEDPTLVDALMTRARLYRLIGDDQREARDLERMIRTYETSYAFASYAYDDHKPAAARLVELYRGPLHDLERAEFHAANLPVMLRKPLHMPRYLLQLGEIQEQRGQPLRALATYREVLRFIAARNADFRRNDQRICDELPSDAERAACHAELRAYSTDVEPREAGQARERIARLQAAIAGDRPAARAAARGGP